MSNPRMEGEVNLKLWEVILNQLNNCAINSRLAYNVRGVLISVHKVSEEDFKLTNT